MAKSKQEGGNKPVNMADIAATLVQSAQPEAVVEEELDTEAEAEVEEDPTSGESEAEEELSVSGDEGDEQEGSDEQPDDADDDEPEYLEIRDDDLITVVVDGQEQELTIGELKKAHSLGGATEKRLQEATELRKTALAERTQMLEKLAEEERSLTEALSSLDDSVFAPVIPAPNDQLRRSNPEQYLRHKDAYDADQRRIAEAKKAVQDRLTQIKDQRNARLNEYSQQAGRIIVQEIPELADQAKAPAMLQRLAETAKSYGYTDQEIQSALDPRMFMLVRDAMRFREMTSRAKERGDPKNLEGQKEKKVRRLRSGNTQAKNRVRQSDKQRQAVTARAKATGKVSDVAATLIVPRG